MALTSALYNECTSGSPDEVGYRLRQTRGTLRLAVNELALHASCEAWPKDKAFRLIGSLGARHRTAPPARRADMPARAGVSVPSIAGFHHHGNRLGGNPSLLGWPFTLLRAELGGLQRTSAAGRAPPGNWV